MNNCIGSLVLFSFLTSLNKDMRMFNILQLVGKYHVGKYNSFGHQRP